jgi:hypothetical protein
MSTFSSTKRAVAGRSRNHRNEEKEPDIWWFEYDPKEFAGAREIWLEATGYSGSVRSIEIKLEYNGVSQSAKATAVWAIQTDVRHQNAEAFPVKEWDDFPTSGFIYTSLLASQHFGLTYHLGNYDSNAIVVSVRFLSRYAEADYYWSASP